jgi:predicted DNA binding CopG/RHH family protein
MPRPPPKDKERINFFIPTKTLDALKALASRRGTNYSELLRQAAREFAVAELTKERNNEIT